jgi:hypothetical protein
LGQARILPILDPHYPLVPSIRIIGDTYFGITLIRGFYVYTYRKVFFLN